MDNGKIDQCLHALDRIAGELREAREILLPFTDGYVPVMIPADMLASIGAAPGTDAPVLLQFEQRGGKILIKKKAERGKEK